MVDKNNDISVVIKTYAEEANNSVSKLVNNLEMISSQISEIYVAMEKTSTSTKKLSKTSTTLKKTMSKMFDAGKLYLYWNVTKRIRDTLVGLINSSIDYIETQNLFDVSMGNQSDKAYEFMNTMAKTFGMARTELMNYQASFNNVMKSLPGLNDETAYALSETLMKMAGDYASLFNFTLPKAMEKFQAAITGSVKPIRDKTGLDITEKTIQGVATNLGVEKTVGQLNQVEKRLLRIIALQDQLNEVGARGDFAKTLESPSNQLKVLQQQLQELGVWLGNVFIGTIGKILPYINGFVMALVAMAKALAIFVGYTETKYDDPLQVEDTTGSVDDLTNSLGGAASKAKELKKILMGFDVLNVITTPSEDSSGGGGSATSIDPAILNALKEYDNLMNGISMKAEEIKKKILEFFGFTDDGAGNFTFKFSNMNDILQDLIITLGALLAIKFVTKIANWIKKANEFKESLKNLDTTSKNLNKAIGVILTITGIVFEYKALKNVIETGELSMATIAEMIGGTLATGGGVAMTFGIKAGLIVTLVLTAINLGAALATQINKGNIGEHISKRFGEKYGLEYENGNFITRFKFNFQLVLGSVADLITTPFESVLEEKFGIDDKTKQEIIFDYIDIWNNISKLTNIFDTDTFTESWKGAWEGLKKLTGNTIVGEFFQACFDFVTATLKLINIFNPEEMLKSWQTVWETIKTWFEGTGVGEFFQTVYNLITGKDWDKVWEAIKTAGENMWNEFDEWWQNTALKKWWDEHVAPWFTEEKWDKIATTAKNALEKKWNEFKEKFNPIQNWFNEKVAPWFTQKKWDEIATTAKNAIETKLNEFKNNFNPIKNWWDEKVAPWFTKEKWRQVANNAVNGIKTAFSNMNISFKLPHFSWTTTPATGWVADILSALSLPTSLPKLSVSWYAQGGLPDVGEMFVAREAGPELVGKIGNSSAVVNNQQIVESVSRGVAQAVSQVMNKQQGGSYKFYLDGKEMTSVITKIQNRNLSVMGV